MRRTFSAETKRSALERSKIDGVPRCECYRVPNFKPTCGRLPLRTGDIVFEHVEADTMGGPPTLENCAALTLRCAQRKTAQIDTPRITKSNAVRNRHFGTHSAPRKPMPCGRFSRFKKPIGSFGTVPRVSQVARTRAYLQTLPPRRGQETEVSDA